MESFFGTLKKELVHHRKYRTRDEARRDIFDYGDLLRQRAFTFEPGVSIPG